MDRFNGRDYLIAFVLTAVVLLSGIYIGYLLNKQKVSVLVSYLESVESRQKENEIDLLLLDALKEKRCDILQSRSLEIESQIGNLSYILSQYDRTKKFDNPDFLTIKRNYIYAYLKYWLQMKSMKDECKLNMTTILYFYSNERCLKCKDQGVVLDYFKKKYDGRLLIFPLDVDMGIYAIDIITSAYGINEYPAIVINEKEVIKDFIGKKELEKTLLKYF